MGRHSVDGSGDGSSSAADGFDVQERWAHDTAVLEVWGDFDLLTTPRFNEAVAAVIAKSPTALIVDLTEVTFLASAGINALVAAQRASESLRFAVVADGPVTGRPIKILGLDEILSLHSAMDDALAAVR
jgi:anti-sigma B factor antagonist